MFKDSMFSRERLVGYDPSLLANSIALIVGAGALGQNVAQDLALSGLGEIRIVDNDVFEEQNRTRSPMYPYEDEKSKFGMAKARVVANKLVKLMTAPNPMIRYANAWIQELGDGVFKDVSIVLSCVDNPRARAYLADKTRFYGIPFIEGGFDGADITLSCYPAFNQLTNEDFPCWRCSHQDLMGAFSCRFYAFQAENVGFIPAIQNASATLGGLQSEATILALHGQMPLSCKALDFNIRNGKTRLIKLSIDPCCPGIHKTLNQQIIKINISVNNTVHDLLLEISKYFNYSVTLHLSYPLIWIAPCTKCAKMVGVYKFDWLWMMMPYCKDCGGQFSILDVNYLSSPLVYTELSMDSTSAILNATCQQVGLPYSTIVEASDQNNQSKFFELSGNAEDLFEKIVSP
ncbi:MAG: ThiF family adenylyltransferase [Thaumarchaeota archaeon]|nr:ThiF family adenylyltransferase [Nitrososphaerota archaeon]